MPALTRRPKMALTSSRDRLGKQMGDQFHSIRLRIREQEEPQDNILHNTVLAT